MGAAVHSSASSRRAVHVAVAILVLGVLGWVAGPAEGDVRAEGTASLINDRDGVALFDRSVPLAPGQPREACLTVGVSDALPGDGVRLTATGVGGSLAAHLLVVVQQGSGGGAGDCTGFLGTTVWSGTLAELALTSSGDGVVTGWQPEGSAVRSFRFVVTLPDDAALAGTAAVGTFAWRLVTGPRPPQPERTPGQEATGGPAPVPTVAPSPTRATSEPSVPPSGSPAPTTTPETPGPGDPDVDLSPGASRNPLLMAAQALGWFVEAVLTPLIGAERAALTAQTAGAVLTSPQYPLGAVLAALAFLLVQHRIDRRDPKLADVALRSRDRELVFADPPPALAGARS